MIELDGSLRRHEVVELLSEIRFVWEDSTATVTIDRDIRDCLVAALTRR